MARPNRNAPASQPAPDPEPVEQAPDVDPAQPGELDVEAWVAAVYDYQNNGGPKPERTYRVAPTEPVHTDAVGAVTPVERPDLEQADDEQPADDEQRDDETAKD